MRRRAILSVIPAVFMVLMSSIVFLPWATAGNAMGNKYTVLDYGNLDTMGNWLIADEKEQFVNVPVMGVLIIHPSGTKILFDLGSDPNHNETWGIMNKYNPIKKERFLKDALKDLGLAPSEIDYVVVSHLHLDHAGGLPLFRGTNAKIIIQKAEAQAAFVGVYTDPMKNIGLKWYSNSGHLEKRDIKTKLFEVSYGNTEKELFETV